MKKTYSPQEIMMLISGMTMLAERERSILALVDDTGKKYNVLIRKLEAEV